MIIETNDVGEALYVKYTPEMLASLVGDVSFSHGQVLTVEEANKLRGVTTTVPIHVDERTQGDYEVICENGTQIKYF